jgi:hypothetical protein
MVYNPYDENGPEVKAQKKMNNFVGGAYDAASNAASNAFPQKRVLNDFKQNVIDPAVNRVSADFQGIDQKAVERNRVNRAGLGDNTDNIPFVVGGNFDPREARKGLSNFTANQSATAPAMMRDGIQSNNLSQDTIDSFKRTQTPQTFIPPGLPPGPGQKSVGQSMGTRYSIGGDWMTTKGGPDARDPVAPQSKNIGNFRRIGNLDVTFDNSVPQNARQAFLTNPIRPTAAIDRYNNQQQQTGPTQGQIASQNAGMFIGNRPRQDLSTQEGRQADSVARKIADKQRMMDFEEQKFAEQSRLDQQRNDISAAGLRNTEQHAANDYELRNRQLANEQEYRRQSGDLAQRAYESQAGLTGEQQKGLALTNQRAERIARLENTYTDPSASTEAKKQAEDQLYGLGQKKRPEPEIFKEKGESLSGLPTETAYIREGGNVRKAVDSPKLLVPNEQALAYLEKNKKDPRIVQIFQNTYGSLPPGFKR